MKYKVPLLIILLIFSRIFFLERTPYEWDSVNFILAVEQFDLSQDRPHPPGYLGYVALGKIVYPIIGNAHTALLTLNIVFTILLLWGIWILGKELLSRQTAGAAVLLSLVNPLVWFYGEVVLVYLAGATLWVWLANLFLWMRKNNSTIVYVVGGMLWGLSGALRPDVMVFMSPLLFYSLKNRIRIGTVSIIIGSFLIGNILWSITTILISKIDFNNMDYLFHYGNEQFSIFMGAPLKKHLSIVLKTIVWLMLGWGWTLPFIILRTQKIRRPAVNKDLNPEVFLLWGVIPGLIFPLLFYLQKAGFILMYMPGLILLGTKWIDDYFAGQRRWRGFYLWGIVMLSSIYFLFYPAKFSPPGVTSLKIHPLHKLDTLTRARIKLMDRYTLSWSRAIKTQYNPETTIILVGGRQYNWRKVGYQLSEFTTVQIFPQPLAGNYGQVSRKDRIVPLKEELCLPPNFNTILFLTEDETFLKEKVQPQLKLVRRSGNFGVSWYEADFPAVLTIAGVKLLRNGV